MEKMAPIIKYNIHPKHLTEINLCLETQVMGQPSMAGVGCNRS